MATPLLLRLGAARRLGLANIARVLAYRAGLRAGVHPVQQVRSTDKATPPFFVAASRDPVPPATRRWLDTAPYFGWLPIEIGEGPPDWHRNPIQGATVANPRAPWWTIPDFDPAVGDIKAVWEASRFDWVIHMAQRAANGQVAEGKRLNRWLEDWCGQNPPYQGPNWKCAQEASIRLIHLGMAGFILRETSNPAAGLRALAADHLRRIAPTVSYAIAQDNNHGTSEAAALFIGGSWLESLGSAEGGRWHRTGRSLLEERVGRLIEPDGTFSQYSVNYHRLLLDTLCMTEVWRRHLSLPPFSARFAGKAAAAAGWLRRLVLGSAGDSPNLGTNDGASLLPLTDADYRDFRPSVQLASALFEGRAAFAPGPWDRQLDWLDVVSAPTRAEPAQSNVMPNGGLIHLAVGPANAILRFPRFRFRPSHADALHLDLWVDGENILRDGGSYSYAADRETQDYITGVRGHNSIQFDDHDQMPRLGRFLWGSWLETDSPASAEAIGESWQASARYRDRWGDRHERSVELRPDRLRVVDRVSGFRSRAVLRWRLRPGGWRLDGSTVTDGRHHLAVSSDVPIVRCQLVEGWESRYYFQWSALPVLEVEVASAATLETVHRWNG